MMRTIMYPSCIFKLGDSVAGEQNISVF